MSDVIDTYVKDKVRVRVMAHVWIIMYIGVVQEVNMDVRIKGAPPRPARAPYGIVLEVSFKEGHPLPPPMSILL